jgi:hypothetical protein
MKKYAFLIFCAFLSAILASCESTTTPTTGNTVFTDSTLFILSEGGFNKNNAELDGYSLKKDSLSVDIIKPLGDVGNDIRIIGKRMFIVVENSNKILSVNPDSVADRTSIQFPAGATPYNMAQVSSSEVWVSELYASQIGVLNVNSNTLISQIKIDTSLAYISVFNGKAYLLTNANNLEVLDIATQKVLSNKFIGEYPAQIVIDSIRNSIIVLTYGDAYVAKTLAKIFWIDPNTYSAKDSIVIPATDYINQMVSTGNKAYLTYSDRLDVLDFTTHKISSFIPSSYYKGIFDAATNRLILGKSNSNAAGTVDILDASSGTEKKSLLSGIYPGHFAIYRK